MINSSLNTLDGPEACVIAAALVIKIIYERPFDAVIKKDPHQTKSTRQGRMALFHDHTAAPGIIFYVLDLVADPEI
jgi:hypothetical protein